MQRIFIVFLAVFFGCSSSSTKPVVVPTPTLGPSVNIWLTNPDRSSALTPLVSTVFKKETSQLSTITIDTTVTYQTMDGFGFSLTDGSAQVIHQNMSAADQASLLNDLFTTNQGGIGISYLRISIGASDLSDHVYSLDDMPAGQTDATLANFSIDAIRTDLLPVLKAIISLNPQIKIIATPWSAPTWMKSNGSAVGGSLQTQYYTAYANYFVKYIQAMAAEGITITAITPQNEPENPYNTPSMTMTREEQNSFVQSLGAAFASAGLTTKIVLFDHNCDDPNFPISILNDTKTRPYVDGSAFHMYAGDISALGVVHNAYPDKNVYFTEQWTSAQGSFGGDLMWHVKTLIVGASRNWSRNVIEWNLATNESYGPHTNGGCSQCLGAITVNSGSGQVSKNVSYYIIAHASKFVKPGAVRISSLIVDNLQNVAFQNPDGTKVLIVANDNSTTKSFSIKYKDMVAAASLQAGAVATYVW
ncbi:MAG: glucosylceramidase [Bacteroidetes bacterium]|nr:glucosylceramidase [Bacteroidota bacterium]